jgi:hypothetical protein
MLALKSHGIPGGTGDEIELGNYINETYLEVEV